MCVCVCVCVCVKSTVYSCSIMNFYLNIYRVGLPKVWNPKLTKKCQKLLWMLPFSFGAGSNDLLGWKTVDFEAFPAIFSSKCPFYVCFSLIVLSNWHQSRCVQLKQIIAHTAQLVATDQKKQLAVMVNGATHNEERKMPKGTNFVDSWRAKRQKEATMRRQAIVFRDCTFPGTRKNVYGPGDWKCSGSYRKSRTTLLITAKKKKSSSCFASVMKEIIQGGGPHRGPPTQLCESTFR